MTCKILVSGGMVSYLDSVDLVETTTESAIERVVLGRVLQLVEILLVQEALCRRPLDTLRAVLVLTLCLPGGLTFTASKEEIFGRSPTNSAIGLPATSSFIFPTTGLFAPNPGS